MFDMKMQNLEGYIHAGRYVLYMYAHRKKNFVCMQQICRDNHLIRIFPYDPV